MEPIVRKQFEAGSDCHKSVKNAISHYAQAGRHLEAN